MIFITKFVLNFKTAPKKVNHFPPKRVFIKVLHMWINFVVSFKFDFLDVKSIGKLEKKKKNTLKINFKLV